MKRALAILAAVGTTVGTLAAPLGTAFTYQGSLRENSGAATGLYDFQFKLFDALSGGAQVGATVAVNDLQVSQGQFTTPLDFGAQFAGQKRWLQVEVRPGASTGSYTVLAPRQELTAAPNALFSASPWATGAGGIAYTGAGNVGIGTASPAGKIDVVSGDNSFFRIDSSWGDIHANGGNDGYFGIFNDGPAGGRTDFLSQGVTHMSIGNTGNVGIGTTAPWTRLMVVRNDTGHAFWAFAQSTANDANFGAAGSTSSSHPGSAGVYGEAASGSGVRGVGLGAGAGVWGTSLQGDGVLGTASTPNRSGVAGISTSVSGYGGYFQNSANGVALRADGLAQVKILQILGGGDVAEPFDVAPSGSEPPVPGHVVVIDAAHPGKLRLCDGAYDPSVAGVISGANGLSPGMVLRAADRTDANGEHPVAMTGRVWCYADASFGAIQPGDRLTTSTVPGHAMKATDAARADGTVIGKAMTGLDEGRGLVLVLVNLQ